MKTYNQYLNVSPYPYQKEGADFLFKHHYSILGDDMGLGKTLQALIVAFTEGLKGKKTLIVCPAFLRTNWETEIDKFSKHYHWVKKIVQKKELKEFDPRSCIAIVSYAAMKEARNLFEWADIVIADEAHKLKNIDATVTLRFHQYVYEETPERLILSTGTPMPNNVTELYSLLLLCSYTLLPTNGLNIADKYPLAEDFYQRFSNEINYSVRVKGGGSRNLVRYEGVKNNDELQKYLEGKFIRRKSEDVLDLKERQYRNIIAAYKENSKLAKEFYKFNQSDKPSDSSEKAKSALLKAPFTAELAMQIKERGDGPVVIFTDHVKSCELIAKKLGCPYIHGGISMKKRDEYKDAFQRGELDYIVITIGAGSTGLTLTRSSQLIFNDLNWVPSENDQASKRIHRIGQDKACWIYFVVGSKQDEKINNIITKKMRDIKEVL